MVDQNTVRAIADATAGVILAGGASQRMGGHSKALTQLAGTPLIQHVLGKLAPQVSALSISVHEHDPALVDLIIPQIKDEPIQRMGPVAGLAAAIKWCRGLSQPRWLVIVPVDMPFLPATIVADLILGANSTNAIAASVANKGQLYPTVSVWSMSAANKLLHLVDVENVQALHSLLDRVGYKEVEFADDVAFMNINTPEDLRLAEHIFVNQQPQTRGCSHG